jgi:hypothetical protein
VLWRREALLRALDDVPDICSWRLAGDWRLYFALLTGAPGSVAYIAEPLNTHRRHDAGVTQLLDADAHVREIARMHKIIAKAFRLDADATAGQADYVDRVAAQLAGRKEASSSFLKKRTKKTS